MRKLNHIRIDSMFEPEVWINGITIPKKELNIKLISEKIEGWSLGASLSACHLEMLVPFAHKIAEARAPSDANAYELLGRTKQVRGEYQRKIRYYKINSKAYEERIQKMSPNAKAVADLALNLTAGFQKV